MEFCYKTVGVDFYAVEFGVVRQHKGYRVSMLTMEIINCFEVNCGKNVGINHHKRVIIPEISHIYDSAPGSKNMRFVPGFYRDGIGVLRDKGFDLRMQVMGVDHNRLAAGFNQFGDQDIQKRSAANCEERFRGVVCIRAQPRAQAC